MEAVCASAGPAGFRPAGTATGARPEDGGLFRATLAGLRALLSEEPVLKAGAPAVGGGQAGTEMSPAYPPLSPEPPGWLLREALKKHPSRAKKKAGSRKGGRGF